MIVYLNKPQLAEYLGISRSTVEGLKLPPADAQMGKQLGWLPATIDEWNKRRPGSGKWKNERWHLPPELQ